jgi:hypothetical protein
MLGAAGGNIMIFTNRLARVALAALLPAAAAAQQSVGFWLAAQLGNIQCIRAEFRTTKEHVSPSRMAVPR